VTKIRDVEKDHDSFLALKPTRARETARSARAKVDKATEARLSDLGDQVHRLSNANLALTNLLKRAIHLAPTHLQKELHASWDAIRAATFDEVHP
jgi:hypothetical protein